MGIVPLGGAGKKKTEVKHNSRYVFWYLSLCQTYSGTQKLPMHLRRKIPKPVK
jgi:hypothetical protein